MTNVTIFEVFFLRFCWYLIFNFAAKSLLVEIIFRHLTSNNWITVILVCLFIVLAWLRSRYGERFIDFLSILFSNKYFNTHDKSPSVFNFFSFICFVLNGLILSLLLYFLVISLDFNWIPANQFILYIQLFIGYNIFIGVKYMIEKIIGNIFNIEKLLDNYLFFKITYKNFLALCLIPFLLIINYACHPSPFTFLIGFLTFIVLNLLLLLNYYVKNQKLLLTHWFYFILYLCTLEIAPYIILYKVVTPVS